MKFLCLLFALASGAAIFGLEARAADQSSFKTLEAKAFDSLSPSQMETSALYYNDKVLSFADWNKQFPDEAKSLVLFPGYTEPTVTEIKDGQKKKILELLMVFVGRFKIRISNPPSKIDLKSLINLQTIGSFDGEIQHIAINQNQIMPNVVGRGQINNFQWCNKAGPDIMRPTREVDLSYLNRPDRQWCNDSARSICIESCYLFNSFWKEGVGAVNLGYSESEKKDYGIASQSEVRYFLSESELGLPVSVQKLTGVNTPVRGGFEQSLFYFNQVMQFGKVIAIIQDDPSDPSKSITSTFFVIGIKKRTYDKDFKMFGTVKDVLMGTSSLFNTDAGLTAGLPIYSKNTVNKIVESLAKKH